MHKNPNLGYCYRHKQATSQVVRLQTCEVCSETNRYEWCRDRSSTKVNPKETNRPQNEENMNEILDMLTDSTRKATILAQQKGASAWLRTLPIEEHGFTLHKGAFRDALALRYGWQPNGLSTTCSCGKENSVQHALSCTKGGLPIHRHNDICDITASLMEEVSVSTETEPALQLLTGETLHGASANTQDNGRVDIKCKGFWNSWQDAFFDDRVFNPLASSNQNSTIDMTFRRHEREKKRIYEQESGRLNMGLLHPSFSQHQVEWALPQLLHMKDWQPCWRK